MKERKKDTDVERRKEAIVRMRERKPERKTEQ